MKVAIVGVSGAVGQEFLRVLDEEISLGGRVSLIGSKRSAGTKYTFRGKQIRSNFCNTTMTLKGGDIAFHWPVQASSKEFEDYYPVWCRRLITPALSVMDADVPLVVPK